MAEIKELEVGKGYNKIEVAQLINEPKVSALQTGLLYCDNRSTTMLFVTLNKDKKEKDHKYNDFFSSEYFEWDGQNGHHIENERIKAIVNGEVDVHLMARITGKTKGKATPFIYCGELEFVDYDPETSHPIHLTYLSLDFQSHTKNESLKALYEWKPKGDNRSDKIVNYKKKIGEKRKRTYKAPSTTERKGLVTSRVGQGYYRDLLLQKWNYQCALTGCKQTNLLIASHIVPWSESNESERLMMGQ